MPRIYKVNVKQLTDLYCMSGDLGSAFGERLLMQDGTSIHTAFLAARKKQDPAYAKEVAVSGTETFFAGGTEHSLEIGGRIDGMTTRENEPVIEEIKTGDIPAESGEWKGSHAYQLLCYAYMYMSGEGFAECTVRLLYVNLECEPLIELERRVARTELKALFESIVGLYVERLAVEIARVARRDESLSTLEFPFPGYRKGQRELAVNAYRAIKGRYRLFCRAPTGIGKTMAILYAALKAMPEEQGMKLFYLTSRTTQSMAVSTALSILRARGLFARSVIITAKAKACLKPEPICDPAVCEYAAGYYDRISVCMKEMADLQDLDRDAIAHYAHKHMLCPFELSLDLALVSDCIICDFNYLFDPRVFLKRFFMTSSQLYVFLVDEAHNLVDRSREMYSPVLEKAPFLGLKRLLPKGAPLRNTVSATNAWFVAERKALGNGTYRADREPPAALCALLEVFVSEAESFLAQNPKAAFKAGLLDLYFDASFFLKGVELASDRNAKGSYVTTIERIGSDMRVKLLCMDTSGFIRQKTSLGISTIFFSASLLPMRYFFSMFEGGESDRCLELGSPFPRSNLALGRVDSVSTRYAGRDESYAPIARIVIDLVSKYPANYIVFFPSYVYMEKVFACATEIGSPIPVVCQQKKMTEEERGAFLERFGSVGATLGFAVMGGIFGEGIDLAGERLKGAIIIGVGLPQVSKERDLVRRYYESVFGNGFDYAYTYPGFSKVLQAAGRVIRTERDTGIVLLVDDRFSGKKYIDLYPPEWKEMKVLKGRQDLDRFLNDIPAGWFG